ncbi:mechanosensitive ion channel protein MscS [Dyadobacter bucti]|uniref:mechanosensitive ion channel protein MscS n=1 Tax=Dyadobacter bucti TaxID=2572203 RepID=UPI00110882AF|nr:mechanosensitive ion channel protein MscS [Dyadobacter bucti]
MNTSSKVFYLLVACAGIIFIPYLGAWICFDGHFDHNYFQYPPLVAPPKAGFSLLVFVAVAFLFFCIALLYLMPDIFGFKKSVKPPSPPVKRVPLPIWFWLGLVMWGSTLWILWAKLSEPRWIIIWADLPLFWGFALLMDGWVYVRTGGKSIIGRSGRELIGIGVASVSGWLIFEYLNFFVDDNWIYPKGDMIPDNQFTIYAVIGSAGLMPLAFEWYCLLLTFDGLKNRFSNGPKIRIAGWLGYVMLAVCYLALFFIAFYPDTLFTLLWVVPLIILSIVLEKLEIWTPFNMVKDGNWSPVLLFALSYLIQGFLLEFQNYFSAYHENGQIITQTPAYWAYSVPYVNVYHIFEMPALGFMGYLPFGTYCIIWWIVFAFLLNIPSNFTDPKHLDI